MWLIPLQCKYEFYTYFVRFEKYVESQFGKKIKFFQLDGGGEFISNVFKNHPHQNGILHHISCPYIPEKNGLIEHHHRIIHELGLTMLYHRGTPKQFWVEAFAPVSFLINRLPSRPIDNISPYFALHGKHLDY